MGHFDSQYRRLRVMLDSRISRHFGSSKKLALGASELCQGRLYSWMSSTQASAVSPRLKAHASCVLRFAVSVRIRVGLDCRCYEHARSVRSQAPEIRGICAHSGWIGLPVL